MKEQKIEDVVTVCGGYVDRRANALAVSTLQDGLDLEIGGSEMGDRVKVGGELWKGVGLSGFFTGLMEEE